MENYSAMIRSTFDFGSVRDAEVLFELCVRNAFPFRHFIILANIAYQFFY